MRFGVWGLGFRSSGFMVWGLGLVKGLVTGYFLGPISIMASSI